MRQPQLALCLVRPVGFDWATQDHATRLSGWETIVADAQLAKWLSHLSLTHLYVGSEFCEHLLPSRRSLRLAMSAASNAGIKFVLQTPVASPAVIRDLEGLLPLLPAESEIVVNDWGVAHLVRERFPTLRGIAGRILCRMIKDPRLPGSDWAPQCKPGFDSPPLLNLFRRLGLERIEIDAPMFPTHGTFAALPPPTGVHLPFSYVAKGRMCRIGSMSIAGPERFAVGRKCRKECLVLSATTERPGAFDPHATFHIGNTVFSRHSTAMLQAIMHAAEGGEVERLIVPGEPA
jgi:hypothetical protein